MRVESVAESVVEFTVGLFAGMDFIAGVIVICLLIIGINGLMIYRNYIVYRHRSRAMDIIHEKRMEAIHSGQGADPLSSWDELEKYGSYSDMLTGDLFKWKFEDFYPGLDRRKLNIGEKKGHERS